MFGSVLYISTVKRSVGLITDFMAPLSVFSTCEISDALIKLGVPHGGFIPDIHMLSPSPPSNVCLCARAYTVQMVPADPSVPKLSSHFVDTVPFESVIVINAPHRSVLLYFFLFFMSTDKCNCRCQKRRLGRTHDGWCTRPRCSRSHHLWSLQRYLRAPLCQIPRFCSRSLHTWPVTFHLPISDQGPPRHLSASRIVSLRQTLNGRVSTCHHTGWRLDDR